MKTNILLYITFILLLSMGCENFLDESPVDSITDRTAITDRESAESVIAALYELYPGRPAFILAAMSDEQNDVPGDSEFTLNAVQPTTGGITGAWSQSWELIYTANNIVQEIPRVVELTLEAKNQYVAEAKTMCALQYLVYLIPLWGDVPWTESTDIEVLRKISRIPKNEVLNNIISDLLEAELHLPDEYDTEAKTRTRITRGAAKAILARAYLYQENWQGAENKATEVINNRLYELQTNYEDVFTPNSKESIFELWSNVFTNEGVAQNFFPESLDGRYAYAPTVKIQNAFEPGDLRKATALNTDDNGLVYIFKYRDITASGDFQEKKELRLAEMYLIRAEARARQNKLTEAQEDLNIIRNRAGLPNTSASNQNDLLLAIEQERFVELCFEGHRWADLIRTKRVDAVMSEFNPNWNPRAKLLPLPQTELDLNPNLRPQNPGY
ncbi:MAG: RagB/SusD family nutrient uptake outer membrane protein [Cytophagales bacterium]|nr:RagB/SusD family nutrient uptake outer membrane protein [Cytophagales bacterium]